MLPGFFPYRRDKRLLAKGSDFLETHQGIDHISSLPPYWHIAPQNPDNSATIRLLHGLQKIIKFFPVFPQRPFRLFPRIDIHNDSRHSDGSAIRVAFGNTSTILHPDIRPVSFPDAIVDLILF